MDKDEAFHHPQPFDRLHPVVYKVAIGFVLCFVVSAWIFFDRRSDAGLLLGMASYLLLIAIVLPSVMWRTWRKHTGAPADGTLFRNWAAGEFDSHESRLKGSHAAIDALLPLAAVGCGLLALGVVFALTPG